MAGDLDPTRRPASQVTVDERSEGQRIDNFLRHRLKGVPKTRLYRSLRRGEVRVNKGRIRPDYRLKRGDVVRIPPLRYPQAREAHPGEPVLTRLARSVLHEDPGLIVLNKPAGLAVHGGSGTSFGVIEALRRLRPEIKGLDLVHRLDRDTSGCLLVAKKRRILTELHRMLRDGQVAKRYLALVMGRWQGGERRVTSRLRKNTLSSGERLVRLDPEGKRAVSQFKALETTRNASLIEARLLTGRTHQIRVHCASIGCPIAGDPKYGDRDFNRRGRHWGLRRMFLHASRVEFSHPTSGVTVRFDAPLPDDLQAILDRLGLKR